MGAKIKPKSKYDPLCENESEVDNFKNWVKCMAGNNTPAAVIWYIMSNKRVYRVAEFTPIWN